MSAAPAAAPTTVSKDDITCYCFSITYDECEKLFAKKRVTSYDQIPIKTIVASELLIKEHFFPAELGAAESASTTSNTPATAPATNVGSFLANAKAAVYHWMDSHAPVKNMPFRTGFPVLVSNRIRTYYRLMNLPYPIGNLSVTDQELNFSFQDASGKIRSRHRSALGRGQVKTFDLAEISGFDASSSDLQVGYCSLTLVPKSASYFGTMRGYIEFKTPNHTASVHQSNFRMNRMRFFAYGSNGLEGHYRVLLHNHNPKRAKLDAYLCDRWGGVVTAGKFRLPGWETGLYAPKDFFPGLSAADAERGCLIRVKSTQPIASNFFIWDPDSGMITVQHH
jgi:hypothetical protein